MSNLPIGANVLSDREIEYVIKKGGKEQFHCPWDTYADSPYAAYKSGKPWISKKPYAEPEKKNN